MAFGFDRHRGWRNEETIVGAEIWATIVSEFSDVPDVSTITRITVRLALAAILGGILGYERELKGRSAEICDSHACCR